MSAASPAAATSPPGTAPHPLDASCGDQQRHRLSRAGNRRINRVLHIMAIVQLRHDTPGRAYYRRRLAEGKTAMEAIRALKRRLSDVIYRHMLRDATTATRTSPAGQTGATLQSSAADPRTVAKATNAARRPIVISIWFTSANLSYIITDSFAATMADGRLTFTSEQVQA